LNIASYLRLISLLLLLDSSFLLYYLFNININNDDDDIIVLIGLYDIIELIVKDGVLSVIVLVGRWKQREIFWFGERKGELA